MNDTKKSDIEEAQLLFCAPNQGAAADFEQLFPRSKFTFRGPHPRNPHHFMFSCLLAKKIINKLKNAQGGLIKFQIESESKPFILDQSIHCGECRHHLKT